jgi:ribonuclease HII
MVLRTKNLSAKTLKEIREQLPTPGRAVSESILKALEQDRRYGAQEMAQAIRKRKLKNFREGQRLDQLLQFELELWKQGVRRIAGVDEAGMAPLAGPVVAATVILPRRYKLAGLDDSKKIINEHKRQELASQIKRDAVCWSVGRTEAEEIDRINIYQSGLLAMQRAVEGLRVKPDFLLVDARTIPHCPYPQKGIIHGDALSASIAAASIIAKTTRDDFMIEMDRTYPGYGFAAHKGYPTLDHLRALKKLGPIPIHRKSFGPVREALGFNSVQGELFQ